MTPASGYAGRAFAGGIVAEALTGRNRRAIAPVIALAAAAVVLAMLTAPAAAKPPVLGTVGANKGFAGAAWSLPSGVQPEFYEVASDTATGTFGYFLQRNLLRFGTLDPGQTCVVDDGPPLSPGVYYIHVAGHDRDPAAPQIEFSATKRIVILASGGTFACSGSGGGGGGGGGGTVKDADKPSCSLRFARRQDVDKLHVRGRMNEAGMLSATAVVVVGKKPMAFKLSSRTVKTNQFARLPLKLAKKRDLRAVKRALRRGKRLKVRALVTARDRAGNEQERRVTIRLRP
jgi:hypothetical protein